MTPTKTILTGIGVWALLIGIALVLESLFNSSGPEYSAPIPAFLITAVLLGWIPAAIVAVWLSRRG